MHGAFIDHHAYGNSPLHRLDARTKLAIALSYIALVATTPLEQSMLFLFWAPALAFIIPFSGVSILHLLSKALRLWPFVILLTVFVPFFKPGQVLWTLRPALPLDVSLEGLQLFASVLLKAFLAILTMTLLNATTLFVDVLRALEALRVPKVVVSLLSYMYRYLFLLNDEKDRLLLARRCRLIEPPAGLKYGSLLQIIGTLFLRTFERGERVFQAMEARGYDGHTHALHTHPWKRGQIVGSAVVIVGMVVVRVLGVF